MKKSFLRKILHFISVFAILSQSLTPYAVLLPQSAYAQETPTIVEETTTENSTPTVTETPTAPSVDQTTVTPTPDQTTPTETVTPTPDATAVTPTPADQTVTVTPTPEPNANSPPAENQNPTDNTNSSNPNSTPTVTPEVSVTPAPLPENPKDEQLNLVILDNVSAPSIDLEAVEAQGSASLTTDKPDYAPTDTALITGANLLPNTTYTLRIWSDDAPPTGVTAQVTSDENGIFAYAYQLDGTYRPNYAAELKDSEGTVVATVTFTDSETIAANVPFSDSFGSTDVNNVTNWEDSDGNAVGTRIEGTDGARAGSPTTGNVWIGEDDWICRTINATGYQSLQLHYYWRGDNDAENDDNAFVEYKIGGNCNDASGWSNITQIDYNDIETWSSQVTHSLSSGLNNQTFKIRFRTESSQNDEQFRIDDVSITGSAIVDTTPPTVTVNQAVGQVDPTSTSPINFTVVFSESVANFATGDVTLGGTAGATIATVTGSGTTYNVAVSGMTTSGTVIASVDGGKATDAANNPNTASTSTDNTVTYNNPNVANPTLGQSCGIDVALVIDTSTSIDDTELGQMKTAFNGFVSAFTGTPTEMSVVSFDDSAVVQSGFTSNLASLTPVISGINGSGFTNWEDALHDTRLLFPNRNDKPDLIVFTSDGNPTESDGPLSDLQDAITEANLAKGSNIRIVTLGIGADVNQSNLEAISSADAYYSAATFDTLETTLQNLVTDLCGGTITVTKLVDGQPASGWTFTPNVTNGTSTPLSSVTDNNGQAIFTINPTNGEATVNVAETVQDGYALSSVTCTKNQQSIQVSTDTDSVNGLTVDNNDIVSCTFNNTTNVTLPAYICHATGNPNQWVTNSPANLGQLMGHVGIGHQNGNDIIPPIAVVLPSGQNWDAQGQAIWNNNCVVPPTTGTIELKKVWSGTGGQTTLNIGTSAGGTQTASVLTGANGTAPLTTGVKEVETGTYYVSETGGLTNYTSQLSCTKNGQGYVPGANNSLTVNPNDIIVCTFTNTRNTGSVKVNKLLDNDGNGTYEQINPNIFTWSLDGGATNQMGATVAGVNTGTHGVSENTVSNYTYVGWYVGPTNSTQFSCTNTQTLTKTPLPASINVTNGQTTEITICNKRDTGTIELKKVWSGGGGQTTLKIGTNVSGSEVDSQQTGTNGAAPLTTGQNTVAVGTYYLSESNLSSGFSLTATSCFNDVNNNGVNNGEPVVPIGSHSSVTVAAGQHVLCTYTNTRDTGTITIVKDAQPTSDDDFSFDTSSGFTGGDFILEDDGNDNNGGTEESKTVSVPTGQYWVEEDGENGWTLTNLICSDQNSTVNLQTGRATISVEKDEAVTCTFTNKKLATLIIRKDATPNSDENFSFTRSFGGGFELEDDGNDNNGGTEESITFNNLTPGSYTVTENNEPGWTLTDITCSDQTQPNLQGKNVTVALDYGETVTCTFKNLELGRIWGEKFNDKNGNNQDDSGEEGLGNWTMFIDLNNNSVLDQGETSTTTNGSGDYSFNNLLPGDYRVCEVQKPGWFSSLPNQTTCQTTTINTNGGDDDELNFGNHETVTIRAYKVVCENESDLPNWGTGAPNITASTAQDFVEASNEKCHLEENWDFQYGFGAKQGNPGVQTYGNGTTLGLAPTGAGYNNWKTLGATLGTSPAEISISNLEGADRVWVREGLKQDYVPFSYPPGSTPGNNFSAELYCHNDGLNYDNYDFVRSPLYGGTYYCVAFNAYNTGDVEVTKYFDANYNKEFDDGEEVLSGWTINLSDQTSKVTDEDGKVVFENLNVGWYLLSENLQDGWEQTNISCSTDEEENNDNLEIRQLIAIDENGNSHSVRVNPNQTTTCLIGNYTKPELTIEKTNDAVGNKQPNDIVNFTLTLTASKSAAKDVTVTDLLPEGFHYVSGSWQAFLNGNPVAISEPTYASPGVWTLGNMNKNDVYELKYAAKIDGGQQTGIYKDLAWANGKSLANEEVLAFAGVNGNIGDPNFVGTEVTLVNGYQAGTDFKSTKTQEVLGASTSILPATGENTVWAILATLFGLTGASMLLYGLKIRRNK